MVCVFQCCRSIRVVVLGAVVVVVEAEMTTVRCFRRLPHTKYRLRGQETWTICLAVVAAYWEPAVAQGVVTDIRLDLNLPILPHLYITPRQVSRARSEPGGTRWRMGGEVKGNLANGVGSQYSHATSVRGISSITQADAHTSAASSRQNWCPHRFKWTRPFRGKTKSGFCACAITFRTKYTSFVTIIAGEECVAQTAPCPKY